MANLNLSEFTEKTFVADADWTFVWDTAGLISKKVSRNNWLNSGELTTSAPVTISQTWNASAVAFTALKVNATSTNSASGSLLLDLQVGGTTQFSVTKAGRTKVGNVIDIGASLLSWESPYLRTYSPFSCTVLDIGALSDTILLRDGAANTLALRNGTNAQTFNVYGTYTSGSVYERLTLSAPSAANAIIGTNRSGGTARGLDFHTEGTARMTIGTTGNVGIGTTAPAAPLHIQNIAGLTTLGSSNSLIISGRQAGSTVGERQELNFKSWNGFSGSSASLGIITTSTASFELADLYFAVKATAAGTSPTEVMRITSGGNVGIGTTAPSSKLQVSAGDVEVDTIAKGVILKSPDGTRYRVTVANGGTLSVAAV